MKSLLRPGVLSHVFLKFQESVLVIFRSPAFLNSRRIILVLLGLAWPLASVFGQTASPQQSQSQQPPANIDPPAPKPESLAEAARKAKEKKAPAAKGKVYTEDDISGLKGPGVSVIGDPAKKNPRRGQPGGTDGYPSGYNEQYWRGRAQQILDEIAQTDEQIAEKKEEIKKLGSGGFDVTTGFNQNVAYINDRNGQLKQLEQHKVDLQKRLDELADEGRKAGAPASWFR